MNIGNYPITSGIYCFLNVKNKKRYIGKTVNIKKRYMDHIYSLRRKDHINKYFQNSWYRYGEDSFKFIILEACSREELSTKEKYYIKLWKSNLHNKGYNLSEGGDGGNNRRGRPLTEEQQEKQTRNTPRGSIQHSSKLTDELVLKIKNMVLEFSDISLSKLFNVSPACIWKIRTGRSWKHVKYNS